MATQRRSWMSQPTSIRMYGTSVRVEYGKVYPSAHGEVDQLLINYVSFRQGAYMSYRTANSDDINALQQTLNRSAHHVRHELPTNILRTQDDYPSILELAAR